jgi:hypothetical protein
LKCSGEEKEDEGEDIAEVAAAVCSYENCAVIL